MLAPLIVFAYKRKSHLQKTLEALNRNKMAEETELFIFSDAAKGDSDRNEVEETRAYIREFEKVSKFKNLQLEFSEFNKGLAASVISGVSRIISKYGKVIVVEDDLITAPDFLEFMNSALDYYKDNNDIWSVSGYSPWLRGLKKYPKDVFLYYRAASWGWGTWINRWEKTDWEVSDYQAFLKDKEEQEKFNRGGCDMTRMLMDQMNGKCNSWAIRWCYQQSKEDMYTVFPKISRVRNIGCDDTGTHSKGTRRYDTELSTGNERCVFEKASLDSKIVKEFQELYSSSIKARIRRRIYGRT